MGHLLDQASYDPNSHKQDCAVAGMMGIYLASSTVSPNRLLDTSSKNNLPSTKQTTFLQAIPWRSPTQISRWLKQASWMRTDTITSQIWWQRATQHPNTKQGEASHWGCFPSITPRRASFSTGVVQARPKYNHVVESPVSQDNYAVLWSQQGWSSSESKPLLWWG